MKNKLIYFVLHRHEQYNTAIEYGHLECGARNVSYILTLIGDIQHCSPERMHSDTVQNEWN